VVHAEERRLRPRKWTDRPTRTAQVTLSQQVYYNIEDPRRGWAFMGVSRVENIFPAGLHEYIEEEEAREVLGKMIPRYHAGKEVTTMSDACDFVVHRRGVSPIMSSSTTTTSEGVRLLLSA
jgi:hypothetical protein